MNLSLNDIRDFLKRNSYEFIVSKRKDVISVKIPILNKYCITKVILEESDKDGYKKITITADNSPDMDYYIEDYCVRPFVELVINQTAKNIGYPIDYIVYKGGKCLSDLIKPPNDLVKEKNAFSFIQELQEGDSDVNDLIKKYNLNDDVKDILGE